MSTDRYENPMKDVSFDPLKLLYITESKYEGDWHSTLHAHQYSEIFYIVSGQGEFHFDGAVIPVMTDQIVMINSNVVHTEAAAAFCTMEYLVIGVDGCDLLFTNGDDRQYCIIDCTSENREILNYMKQILLEMEEKLLHYHVIAQNLLQILFVKLLRYRAVVLEQATTSKSSIQCAIVKRYLDSHYKESITLDTLAKMTYLSKYHLAHIFAREYGVSPINYLVRRRIAESRYLLAQTDYRISEIALMLGFSSASYFSQSFSRFENTNPQNYRQRAKRELNKG